MRYPEIRQQNRRMLLLLLAGLVLLNKRRHLEAPSKQSYLFNILAKAEKSFRRIIYRDEYFPPAHGFFPRRVL